jgi:hypothetical protein
MAGLVRADIGSAPSRSGTESALELRLRSALSSAQIRAVYRKLTHRQK